MSSALDQLSRAERAEFVRLLAKAALARVLKDTDRPEETSADRAEAVR